MASADRILKILLQLQADLTGTNQVKGALGDLSQKLTEIEKINAWGNYLAGAKQAQAASQQVTSSLASWETALKFAGAEVVFHKISEAIQEIPQRLAEGVKEGISFNAELQTLQASLAGILLQTQPERFGNFATAKAQAADYLDLLKQRANELGIAYTDLFETFQHIQAVLSAAGVTDFNQQLGLAVTLTRALQAAGVNASVAFRDIGDILRGQASIARVGGTALASLMGFQSPAELDEFTNQLRATGNVYDGFMQKLKGVQTTSTELGQTFTADVNRMKNALLDLESEAAKPIMAPLQHDAEAFTQSAKTDEVRAYARVLGDIGVVALDMAAGLVKAAASAGELINKYQELAAVIGAFPGASPIAKALGVISDSASLNLQQVQYERLQQSYEVLRKETLEAHTQEQQDQARADISAKIEQIQTQIYAGQFKNREEAVKWLETIRSLLEVFQFIAGTAPQVSVKPPDLSAWNDAIAKINDQINLANAAATNDPAEIAKARWQQAYDAAVKMLQPLAVTKEQEGEIYTKAQQIADAIYNQVTAQGERKAGQADLTTLLREESTLLQDIRNKQQLINESPFLSADEKHASLIELYRQESAVITDTEQKVQAYIEKEKEIGGPESQAHIAELQQKLQQLGFEYDQLQLKLQTADFGSQLRGELTNWANSFGTTAHQVGSAIEGSINAALQSLNTLLLTGKFNAQDLLLQIAKIGLTLLEQMAIQRVMMAINSAFAVGQAHTTAPLVAAAWATPATLVSIATEGEADIQAPIAIAGAIAATQGIAGFGGGFKKGGFTGYGDPDDVAGPAHFMEFYFGKQAVETLGVDFLQKLHAAAMTGDERAIASAVSDRAELPLPMPPLTGPTGIGPASGPGPAGDYPPAGGGSVPDPYPTVTIGVNPPVDVTPVAPPGFGDMPSTPGMPNVPAEGPSDVPSGGLNDPSSDPDSTPAADNPDPADSPSDSPSDSSDDPSGDDGTSPPERGTAAPMPVVGQSAWEGTGESFNFLMGHQQLHGGGPVLGPDEMPIVGKIGEFMMRNRAVDFHGEDMMHLINDARIPVGPMMHDGGLLGSDGRQTNDAPGDLLTTRQHTFIIVFDKDEAAKMAFNSPAGQTSIMDFINNRRVDLGLPS